MERKYSANLTGAWFLFYEIKQVIKLLNKEMTDKEIRMKVMEENLFQYKSKSSIIRVFPSVIRRAKSLNIELRNLIITESIENGKLINLLSIMNDDLLFETFMNEIIKVKYREKDILLTKKDINLYFMQKAEQNEKVASYTNATLNKLRQVYLKILVETGLLTSTRDEELIKIFIDNQIRTILISNGYEKFVNIFEGE